MDYKNILIVPKNHFIFLISAIKLKKNMSFKIIFLVQFLLFTSISYAQETAKEYQEVKEKYNSKVFTYTIDPEEADKQPQNSDWAQGLLKIITSIRWDYLLYLITYLLVLGVRNIAMKRPSSLGFFSMFAISAQSLAKSMSSFSPKLV